MIVNRVRDTVYVKRSSVIEARKMGETRLTAGEDLGAAVRVRDGYVFPVVPAGTDERKDHGNP